MKHISSWHDDDVVKHLLELSEGYDDADPTSPKSPTATVADSMYRFAEPSQSLIFLDWDDTLFPTSDLFDNWGLPARTEQWDRVVLTAEQTLSLERWREVLSIYLRTACALSDRCVVVTNAKRGWVESCVARFAPNLQMQFSAANGPRVIYAREDWKTQQRLHPGSPRGNPAKFSNESPTQEEICEELTKAKFIAMRREAKEFYAQYPDQTWKNILSVGDAKYEHDAAQDLAFRRKSPEGERLRLKAVITPASPSINDLTYRLRLATLLFRAYVHFDGDLDLDMNTPERLQAIADALEMPELRSVIRPMPIREEDEDELEDEFDEVAIIVQNRIME